MEKVILKAKDSHLNSNAKNNLLKLIDKISPSHKVFIENNTSKNIIFEIGFSDKYDLLYDNGRVLNLVKNNDEIYYLKT